VKRPFRLQVIRGDLLGECPQQVEPRHERHRDPQSALIVIVCGLVLGAAGVTMAVLGVLEGCR
jgi:hypothetical protein